MVLERGAIQPDEMSLARLKDWLRANDLRPGGLARRIMQQNHSYIFFSSAPDSGDEGPIGGEGIALTPLRSLAIDRNLWNYGLPFWIKAELPFAGNGPESFQRLMIGQDTGSAILGAARGDVFFGSGARAGALAGNIRHKAELTLLSPKPIG